LVIDLRRLREDPEAVRASQRARGGDPSLVDDLLAADERRRAAVDLASRLRAEQKAASEAVRSAPDKAVAIAAAKGLKPRIEEAEEEERTATQIARDLQLSVPNIVAEGVPPGGEDCFRLLYESTVPTIAFPPRDHVDLGERLEVLDVERAGKVSGARFAFLTGAGALLELALVQLALQRAIAAGATPMIPPALVKPETMEGTGFLGAHAAEVYRLRDDDLYLVGTSEVPLAAYHADEDLDLATLPRRYAGFSSCFRREAGSYGKDTRGIIRVHQFDKVEMFSFTTVEAADEEHQRLLGIERELLEALEIPYRVIEVAAGDLGSSAARKFDCEAWLPSQRRWMEVTSTSNCTDFQARRLRVRVRSGSGGAREYAATLNGTLVAVGRTLVALLENHQQADGSVVIPPALRPAMAAFGVGNRLEPRS
jgi:seryl-tRNA synthetase